jgi:hypothetical protein
MVKIADASLNRFGNKSPKGRESPSEEPLFDIPKPISIIDTVELDEEIQLDRERLEEDRSRMEGFHSEGYMASIATLLGFQD